MSSIKQVSDLRNYATVLREVEVKSPVYLTKNGYGKHTIIDIEDYERYQVMKETLNLYANIEKGFRSGEEEGWIDKEAADGIIEEMIRRYKA